MMTSGHPFNTTEFFFLVADAYWKVGDNPFVAEDRPILIHEEGIYYGNWWGPISTSVVVNHLTGEIIYGSAITPAARMAVVAFLESLNGG